jgi:hypothetical protein
VSPPRFDLRNEVTIETKIRWASITLLPPALPAPRPQQFRLDSDTLAGELVSSVTWEVSDNFVTMLDTWKLPNGVITPVFRIRLRHKTEGHG